MNKSFVNHRPLNTSTGTSRMAHPRRGLGWSW